MTIKIWGVGHCVYDMLNCNHNVDDDDGHNDNDPGVVQKGTINDY